MKTCFKCGEAKPLEAFYRHPQMGDGHLNKCIDCTKKDARTHRILNPEKVRQYDRDRAHEPHRRAQRNAKIEAEKAAHPERAKARYAVANALRDGKLKRLPCAFCGADEQLEAHHHDYNKPLEITWLCSACHSRYHALEQMAGRSEAA